MTDGDLLPDRLPGNTQLPAKLADKLKAAVLESKGLGTRRRYRAALQGYLDWCQTVGVRQPLPASPELVASHLVAMAEDGYALESIKVSRAALKLAHDQLQDDERRVRRNPPLFTGPNPCDALVVKQSLSAISRKLPALTRPVAALMPQLLRQCCDKLAGHRFEARNRAILLLGWRTAMRRSELTALDLEDLAYKPDRLLVTIKSHLVYAKGGYQSVQGSKTEVAKRTIPVARGSGGYDAYRAVEAYREWRRNCGYGDQDGPLFLSVRGTRLGPNYVNLIVKDAVESCGEDPDQYGAHSLRAGFVTAAFLAGKSPHEIKKQTGHKSLQVLDRYYRDLEAGIRDDAGKDLV